MKKYIFLFLLMSSLFGQAKEKDWSDQTINYPGAKDDSSSLFYADSGEVIKRQYINKMLRAQRVMQDKVGLGNSLPNYPNQILKVAADGFTTVWGEYVDGDSIAWRVDAHDTANIVRGEMTSVQNIVDSIDALQFRSAKIKPIPVNIFSDNKFGQANVRYISTTGLSTNDGLTALTAWDKLETAKLNGVDVLILPGTYNYTTLTVFDSCCGTRDKPIRFIGVGEVILNYSYSVSTQYFLSFRTNYIEFHNIKFGAITLYGYPKFVEIDTWVQEIPISGIKFFNCIFYNNKYNGRMGSYGTGFVIRDKYGNSLNDIVLSGNIFIGLGGSSGGAIGIYLGAQTSTYLKIINNVFEDCRNGIYHSGTDTLNNVYPWDIQIKNNIFNDITTLACIGIQDLTDTSFYKKIYSYNDYYNCTANDFGYGETDTFYNPEFINEGNTRINPIDTDFKFYAQNINIASAGFDLYYLGANPPLDDMLGIYPPYIGSDKKFPQRITTKGLYADYAEIKDFKVDTIKIWPGWSGEFNQSPYLLYIDLYADDNKAQESDFLYDSDTLYIFSNVSSTFDNDSCGSIYMAKSIDNGNSIFDIKQIFNIGQADDGRPIVTKINDTTWIMLNETAYNDPDYGRTSVYRDSIKSFVSISHNRGMTWAITDTLDSLVISGRIKKDKNGYLVMSAYAIHCAPCVSDGVRFLRSTNGGLDWIKTTIYASGTECDLLTSMTDTIYAVARSDYAFASYNNGTTWNRLSDFAIGHTIHVPMMWRLEDGRAAIYKGIEQAGNDTLKIYVSKNKGAIPDWDWEHPFIIASSYPSSYITQTDNYGEYYLGLRVNDIQQIKHIQMNDYPTDIGNPHYLQSNNIKFSGSLITRSDNDQFGYLTFPASIDSIFYPAQDMRSTDFIQVGWANKPPNNINIGAYPNYLGCWLYVSSQLSNSEKISFMWIKRR
jgi:hypothetical protein